MTVGAVPVRAHLDGVDVFERWQANALTAPTRPAIKDDARSLDYGTLAAEVESVAGGLVARGVRAGDRVALQLPNSVDFVVLALSCLWVGAMFVPLAATDPPARVASIVADCEPALIITNESVSDAHPDAIRVVDLRLDHGAATCVAAGRDLAAYAIYTSGTTGSPKGVVIGRRAFAAAVSATINSLGLDHNTRTLCVSPFHFDGSFATLFPTLAIGGGVVTPPRESLLFARYFTRCLLREHITYTGFSSTYLRLLLADPRREKLAETPLKIIALGGEACSAADVEDLWSFMPQVRVFNRYGPTEATIAVTHFEVTPSVIAQGGPVPIGQPHDTASFHLIGLDGNQIVSTGEVGELFIGGEQLMSGYWRSPQLTKSVLRQDVIPGQTVYRTGDLVSRADSGDYVYLDRADRVIKRNAVRISLVELGDALRDVDGVSAAACVAFDNAGAMGIAGFVVTPRSTSDVRLAVGERLPATMLPDLIEVVPVLPMTSSGKVDERLLLAGAGLTTSPPVAPARREA